MRRMLVFAGLAALLIGCGGGGAAAPLYEPPPVALGLVPANAQTAFTVDVVNPYADLATVTFASATPGLAVSTTLPIVLAPGESSEVALAIAPGLPGTFQGNVAFDVAAGGESSLQQTAVSATVESATAALATATIDFGLVAPGTTADRFAIFRNTSSVSSVTLSAVLLPDPAYSLISPSLPTTLAPGADVTLQVRYAATGADIPSGSATLVTNAVNGPFQFGVQAASAVGGQDVITFEDVPFDAGGNTAVQSFSVPSDAISFMVEATTAPGTELGLRLLTGPGGRVYENEALTGAYIWSIQPEIFTAQVPNTDRGSVQLVPGGGTYLLKLLRWSGSASSVDIRVIIERRPNPATKSLATLDLNVFLAAGITPTAATAATDSTLQTVLSTVGTILLQQGIQLGDVDYYDITDTRYDDVSWGEFGPLLELSSAASEVRLNLFFVRTAIGGGILGVSPALGGPALNGTGLSGVMSLYSTNNPSFIGLVAAHEIGHFLGLAHTVEQTGSHDDILDTAECPSSGTNSACTTTGGGYLMHWQAVGGSNITNGQGLVARGHPHMAPRAGAQALQVKPSAAPAIRVPADVSEHWCATCQCLHGTQLK